MSRSFYELFSAEYFDGRGYQRIHPEGAEIAGGLIDEALLMAERAESDLTKNYRGKVLNYSQARARAIRRGIAAVLRAAAAILEEI